VGPPPPGPPPGRFTVRAALVMTGSTPSLPCRVPSLRAHGPGPEGGPGEGRQPSPSPSPSLIPSLRVLDRARLGCPSPSLSPTERDTEAVPVTAPQLAGNLHLITMPLTRVSVTRMTSRLPVEGGSLITMTVPGRGLGGHPSHGIRVRQCAPDHARAAVTPRHQQIGRLLFLIILILIFIRIMSLFFPITLLF
jgi:hypothetical protein